MTHMIKSLYIITVLLIFSSCTYNLKVTMHQDSSATIKTNLVHVSELDKLNASKIIHDITLDTTIMISSFRIDDIDSLGSYLPGYLPQGFFQFNLDQNSLQFSDSHVDTPSSSIQKTIHHYLIEIESERRIKHVEVTSGRIKILENNNVQILRSRRSIKSGKQKSEVIIYFE